MKTRVLLSLGSVLVLSILAGGCSKPASPEKSADSSNDSILAFQPVPESATEVADDPGDMDSDAQVPEVRIDTPTISLPPNINPSVPLSEIIRFSESGVDETVMLAYITNSTSFFSLGPDEIIYLNDIGVPSPVIKGMLDHDIWLKTAAAHSPGATNLNSVVAAKEPGLPYQQEPPPSQDYVAVPTPGITPVDYSPVEYPVEEPAPVAPPEDYGGSPGFYDSLAPYGTWVDVRGYGRCWQPAAIMGNPNWRPYVDRGHWVSTDCGWYWMSDYSWGWAPFHYGRWFQHTQLGWCWVPDSVWGPSWVTWRYSNDICGWAPLPPGAGFMPSGGFVFNGRVVTANCTFNLAPACFTFVSFQNFFDPHLAHHSLAHNQAGQHYKATIAATRIVRTHNGVSNNGLTPDQVAAVTHKPIRPVTIRESGNGAPVIAGTHTERIDPDGQTLTVYRPHVRPQVTSVTTAAQQPRAGVEPSGPDSGHGRTGPSAPSGPRTFADATHVALPTREIRTRVEEPSPVTPDLAHPVNAGQHATASGEAVSFPASAHISSPVHNAPERPQRMTRSETVRTEGEKFPPRSLVVIGRKDQNNRDSARGVAVPLPWAASAPAETVASAPQAQEPDRVASPAPTPVSRPSSAPERRWDRSGQTIAQPPPQSMDRPAFQPDQRRGSVPDVPRREEAPAPQPIRPTAVEQRSAPPVHHDAPAPSRASAPAAQSQSSGDRDTHRR